MDRLFPDECVSCAEVKMKCSLGICLVICSALIGLGRFDSIFIFLTNFLPLILVTLHFITILRFFISSLHNHSILDLPYTFKWPLYIVFQVVSLVIRFQLFVIFWVRVVLTHKVSFGILSHIVLNLSWCSQRSYPGEQGLV